MFGREEPYTESMIGHAAQMREAEELLRLKLQGLPTGEEIDTAAFIELHRTRYFLAQSLALASPSESLRGRARGFNP